MNRLPIILLCLLCGCAYLPQLEAILDAATPPPAEIDATPVEPDFPASPPPEHVKEWPPAYCENTGLVTGRAEWTHDNTKATVNGAELRRHGYTTIPGNRRLPAWVLETGGHLVTFEPWGETLQL